MNRLKQVLKELGIRQKDFAEMAGMSAAQVSEISRQKTRPSLKRLYDFSRVLDVPAYTLIGDYKEPSDLEVLEKAAEILGVEIQVLLDLRKPNQQEK